MGFGSVLSTLGEYLEDQKEEQVDHPSRYIGASVLGSFFLKRVGLDDNAIAKECIEFLEESGVSDFCLGNVYKYLWRLGTKSAIPAPLQPILGWLYDFKLRMDLKKAKWYLTRYIDYHTETAPIEAEAQSANETIQELQSILEVAVDNLDLVKEGDMSRLLQLARSPRLDLA